MLRDLEAMLFASDQPLSAEKLAALMDEKDRKKVREAIDELRSEYDSNGNAFTIVEFGGGYSISTRPEFAALVRRLFRSRRKQRLSRAALEALAIIAYKQPVTRLEIEEIRGVSATGVIGTLLERDLVQIVGRAETLGHPLLYGTTKAMLDYVGLGHIRELPQLSELEDLLAEKEDLKQLAMQRGDDLEVEDFERALNPELEDEPEVDDADEETDEIVDSASDDEAIDDEMPIEVDDSADELEAEEPKAEAASAGADDEVSRVD